MLLSLSLFVFVAGLLTTSSRSNIRANVGPWEFRPREIIHIPHESFSEENPENNFSETPESEISSGDSALLRSGLDLNTESKEVASPSTEFKEVERITYYEKKTGDKSFYPVIDEMLKLHKGSPIIYQEIQITEDDTETKPEEGSQDDLKGEEGNDDDDYEYYYDSEEDDLQDDEPQDDKGGGKKGNKRCRKRRKGRGGGGKGKRGGQGCEPEIGGWWYKFDKEKGYTAGRWGKHPTPGLHPDHYQHGYVVPNHIKQILGAGDDKDAEAKKALPEGGFHKLPHGGGIPSAYGTGWHHGGGWHHNPRRRGKKDKKGKKGKGKKGGGGGGHGGYHHTIGHSAAGGWGGGGFGGGGGGGWGGGHGWGGGGGGGGFGGGFPGGPFGFGGHGGGGKGGGGGKKGGGKGGGKKGGQQQFNEPPALSQIVHFKGKGVERRPYSTKYNQYGWWSPWGIFKLENTNGWIR